MNQLPEKLLIESEDDTIDNYHYRISCQCGMSDHDIDVCLDFESENIKNKDGSASYHHVQCIQFYFFDDAYFHSYWMRIKEALRILLKRRSQIKHDFMLEEPGIKALQYVLNKFQFLNERDKNHR